MPITKATLNAVRAEIEKAIEGIGERHSVSLSFGRGHYGPTGDLLIKVDPVAADGVVETEERAAWKRNAKYRGLSADLLDTTFVSNGRTFTITGLRTRSPKRCVETRRDDGKVYVWEPRSIRSLTGTVCPDCGGKDETCFSCRV